MQCSDCFKGCLTLGIGADDEWGGGGDASPAGPPKFWRGRPPKITIFNEIDQNTYQNFWIFRHLVTFPNKVTEIRGETRIWGVSGFDAPEFVPSVQNFVTLVLACELRVFKVLWF